MEKVKSIYIFLVYTTPISLSFLQGSIPPPPRVSKKSIHVPSTKLLYRVTKNIGKSQK